jgi:hypothetical protein
LDSEKSGLAGWKYGKYCREMQNQKKFPESFVSGLEEVCLEARSSGTSGLELNWFERCKSLEHSSRWLKEWLGHIAVGPESSGK